jgi:hypothetical protein
MFRIGGALQGFVIAADHSGSITGHPESTQALAAGLVFVPMTLARVADLDDLTRQSATVMMEGFSRLSAGVIAVAESESRHGPIGYLERTWGLEIVDCAVAWHRGKVIAGPSGTSVTADVVASAATELLSALGISSDAWPAVLRQLAEVKMPRE